MPDVVYTLSRDQLLRLIRKHFDLGENDRIQKSQVTVLLSPDSEPVVLNDVPKIEITVSSETPEQLAATAPYIPDYLEYDKAVVARNATGTEYKITLTLTLDGETRVAFEGGGEYVSLVFADTLHVHRCAMDWLLMGRREFNAKYSTHIESSDQD